MVAMASALVDSDPDRFLSLFSRTKPWRYVGTLERPRPSAFVTFDEFAADLKQRKGAWYEVFFDAGGDDCFRDWAVNADGKPWVKTGDAQFSPPGYEEAPLVYVRWRREQGRWVVAEIGQPSA